MVQTQLFVHYFLVFFAAERYISLQRGDAHDIVSGEIVKDTMNIRHFTWSGWSIPVFFHMGYRETPLRGMPLTVSREKSV